MHKNKGRKWIRIIKKQECKRSRDTDTFNKVKKTQELFLIFYNPKVFLFSKNSRYCFYLIEKQTSILIIKGTTN